MTLSSSSHRPCWLNAKLYADDVAELEGLPPVADRARQLRAMVDAYGLSAKQRLGFVDRIIEYVAHDTAEQADEFDVGPDFNDPKPDGFPLIWGLTWRARAGAWLWRNRETLRNALS